MNNCQQRQHPQIDGFVATTMTFSQQTSVCTTVDNAPPVYQASAHLLTPPPAYYPYQNAPNLARQTYLGESELPVTYNMHVPPPSHIPVA